MSLIIKMIEGALADLSSQSIKGKFKILEGNGIKGTVLEIKKSVTIGREGDLKTYPFSRLVISRLHCKIYSSFLGEWGVKHLGKGSVSSIKRRDKLVPLERGKKEKLKKGDVIVLGPQEHSYHLEFLVEK